MMQRVRSSALSAPYLAFSSPRPRAPTLSPSRGLMYKYEVVDHLVSHSHLFPQPDHLSFLTPISQSAYHI